MKHETRHYNSLHLVQAFAYEQLLEVLPQISVKEKKRLIGEADKVIASMIRANAESLEDASSSSIFNGTVHLSKQMMDYFAIRALLLQKNAPESSS